MGLHKSDSITWKKTLSESAIGVVHSTIYILLAALSKSLVLIFYMGAHNYQVIRNIYDITTTMDFSWLFENLPQIFWPVERQEHTIHASTLSDRVRTPQCNRHNHKPNANKIYPDHSMCQKWANFMNTFPAPSPNVHIWNCYSETKQTWNLKLPILVSSARRLTDFLDEFSPQISSISIRNFVSVPFCPITILPV